jgi:hypothetical protein
MVRVLADQPREVARLVGMVGLVLCDERGENGDTDVFATAGLDAFMAQPARCSVVSGVDAFRAMYAAVDDFDHWCGRRIEADSGPLFVCTGAGQDPRAARLVKRALLQAKQWCYGVGCRSTGGKSHLVFQDGSGNRVTVGDGGDFDPLLLLERVGLIA